LLEIISILPLNLEFSLIFALYCQKRSNAGDELPSFTSNRSSHEAEAENFLHWSGYKFRCSIANPKISLYASGFGKLGLSGCLHLLLSRAGSITKEHQP
jgi:hypothetical protein